MVEEKDQGVRYGGYNVDYRFFREGGICGTRNCIRLIMSALLNVMEFGEGKGKISSWNGEVWQMAWKVCRRE